MPGEDVTRDRLLALLQRVPSHQNACAYCDAYEMGPHRDDCELKAAIDWLEDIKNRYEWVEGSACGDDTDASDRILGWLLE